MFLINHVFLPPKLPQEADTTDGGEQHLVQQVLETLKIFRTSQDADASETNTAAIDAAIATVSSLGCVHDFSGLEAEATINAERLRAALDELTKNGTWAV